MGDFGWPSGAKGLDQATLKQFDALWYTRGSPYESLDGALFAIQFGRENWWSFIVT
ncbi:MAG: hypothetical protein HY730_05095 [Candidatus Tectomicrobia bacterium]|uniref:Uncharacterized protein n=1 Tax=Tectimicrobiota bacterium TaxID=2528274 RepID=A0A933LQI3_UNCTE|nr:hypothetical protein [Candidatus Tectomicrobia bacterium]